jgi:adenine phosphoribosyltransferase
MESRLRTAIRDVRDFPKPGIVFKDISPILGDPQLFSAVICGLAGRIREEAGTEAVSHIVGVESRGFIFGAAVAHEMGVAFVPVRKPGKLPWRTHRVEYTLEYGTDSLEIHQDAFPAHARVALVDDLLATGGTAAATMELVQKLDVQLVGAFFVIELGWLNGRAKMPGAVVRSLVHYAEE